MNKDNLKLFLASVSILLVVGLAGYQFWTNLDHKATSAPLPLPTPTPDTVEDSTKKETAQYKVPDFNEDKTDPVPKIEESDQAIAKKWTDFFTTTSQSDILVTKDFIRRIVASVENATQRKIPVKFSPLEPAEGELKTKTIGGDQYISESNFSRYDAYVTLAEDANLKKIVHYYFRIYPLFQAAYEDLGVKGYFNDKLVSVIDELLNTPRVKGLIRIVHSSVRYEFSDPKLESLSAVQKILLRMGPKNAEKIKSRFRELKKLLSREEAS